MKIIAGADIIAILITEGKNQCKLTSIIAGIIQGISALTGEEKNILASIVFIVFATVFLWKAPAGLSVCWAFNAIFGVVERKIFTLKIFRRRYLKVPSVEEMLESIAP